MSLPLSRPAARLEHYQARVAHWMHTCFTRDVVDSTQERNHRFLEEALELMQANFGTKEEALMLVEYVFNRPVGEPRQEVGGVLVCLAALCNTVGIDFAAEGEIELARVWQKIPEIRAKHQTKPASSPLPGSG